MDVISSPNACSVTTGGNLWRNKHSTKNIYHASFGVLKASQHKRTSQMRYNLLRLQQSSSNDHYKYIEDKSTYKKCNKKYVVKAVSKPSFDLEPPASNPANILVSVKNFLIAAFWFCYPYSLIAQGLSVISSSFLAVENLSNVSPLFFTGMLQAIIPQLLMSVYMNGVNQLYDLEIDKMNKPYLPLASGKLSYTAGVFIVASCLTLSLWIGWKTGSWPLIWNLVLNTFVWSAYSIDVPLLRWKKYPLLAAMCIVITMAYIFPITLFLHIQTFVFKRPVIFSRSLIVTVIFMSLYSIGISLFKDIPDIEGDKAFGVDSLATRLGQKRVFWICISILESAFGIAFLAGITSSYLWIKIVTGLGHAILASILWHQTKFVDLRSKSSIISFYMLIWKLMYGAYFLLPLIR
ncbi:hypothetical protein VNO78_25502 [Psophocarpus tetragonolobus]|uniref:Glycinol 4-dimethylallyltransferase n=1 Tax=Psophocarpus tetragonolobus TaxID=3891 RepID=A0AAN9S6J8_PSOTE